jgi:hypothetical protein
VHVGLVHRNELASLSRQVHQIAERLQFRPLWLQDTRMSWMNEEIRRLIVP